MADSFNDQFLERVRNVSVSNPDSVVAAMSDEHRNVMIVCETSDNMKLLVNLSRSHIIKQLESNILQSF